MKSKNLSLSQIRTLVNKKLNGDYLWVEANSLVSESEDLASSQFHCLTPKDTPIHQIFFVHGEGLYIVPTEDSEPELYVTPVILWNNELFPSENGYSINLQGALNGILLIGGETVTWSDLALIDVYDITLNPTGAKTTTSGEEVEFYYNAEHEGVIIDSVDYRWMKDLPVKYLGVVNALISAFHQHREHTLKLDKYMNPLT